MYYLCFLSLFILYVDGGACGDSARTFQYGKVTIKKTIQNLNSEINEEYLS